MRNSLPTNCEIEVRGIKLNEKELAYAVIERAFCDLHESDRLQRRDAKNWLTCNDTSPLSFHWFLSILDMVHVKPVVMLRIEQRHKFTKSRLK